MLTIRMKIVNCSVAKPTVVRARISGPLCGEGGSWMERNRWEGGGEKALQVGWDLKQ